MHLRGVVMKKKNLKFAVVNPGEILQNAIDEAGLTQSALALHIGLHSQR